MGEIETDAVIQKVVFVTKLLLSKVVRRVTL